MSLSPRAEKIVSVLVDARFPRDDVEDLLALLVLSAPGELDDDAKALIGRFAGRCGLALGAPPVAMQEAVAAYLQRRPPNEELVRALHTVARDDAAAGGDVGAAVGRFTGVLGGGGDRPAGTVAAGPMARFLVDNNVDKKTRS